MSESPEVTQPKKINWSTWIILLLLIIIGILLVKIYRDDQELHRIKAEKAEAKKQLANAETDLTSTMQKLTAIETELTQKITEIKKLGGNVKELQKAKAEVQRELRSNTTRSEAALKELKERVEGYVVLLKTKDEELERLKHVNKQLLDDNINLKTTQNKLSDSISTLFKDHDELTNKVVLASQLRAENVVIKALSSRGKEYNSPFKNKHTQKLKIEFNIAENKVAPIEGKKIIIRITDENEQVIFDVAKGSGTFLLDGKEEFYTSSQDILFDNSNQKVSFLFEKGSKYVSGKYLLEIFTENYKIGSARFEVE